MTKQYKRTNRVGFYLPLFLIVVPTVVAMRTVAYLDHMNKFGHFNSTSLIMAANITTSVFAILFLLHSLSHHRNDSVPQEGFSNYPTYVPSGILSVATIFVVYELISSMIPTFKSIASYGEKISIESIIVIIAPVAGVASVVSLLLNIVIESKMSQIKSLFGIFTIFFLALYSISIYFDMSSAANVQQRSLTILAIILSAAFFLFETRISLGRSKWHAYVGFGLSSATLLYYASIPALIYYFKNGSIVPGSSIIQLLFMLALGIYITSRVFLLAYAHEDEVCELTDQILDMVHERNKNSASHARVNNLKEDNDSEE